MRIAVIAAQGRSGMAFVQEALAAGHTVHAGIRSNNPFEPNDRLTTFECDATNVTQVTALIDRCDAVVSLIGHVKGSDPFVQATATKTIVRAMDVAGIKRLVSLTGIGVSARNGPLGRAIDFVSAVSDRLGVKRFKDGIAHANVLEASTLDWTILQVLLLTDGEPGKFGVKANGLVKAPTPRREVARAILLILEQRSFVRESALITRP